MSVPTFSSPKLCSGAVETLPVMLRSRHSIPTSDAALPLPQRGGVLRTPLGWGGASLPLYFLVWSRKGSEGAAEVGFTAGKEYKGHNILFKNIFNLLKSLFSKNINLLLFIFLCSALIFLNIN